MSDFADFHNHLIPGVDDGAVDDEQADAALTALSEQGVVAVITTPHLDGSLTSNAHLLTRRLEELDLGWARLERVAARHPGLKVMRGAEIMLNTPEPDVSDPRVRLGGGNFVLVEFGFMTVPPNSAAVLRRLRDSGVVPVLAHPERYAGVHPASELPGQWRASGALLQINAGSVSGRYGPDAQANAHALLKNAQVDYICSDYHARGRPALQGCHRVLSEAGAAEQAMMLMSTNPRRLIAGEMPLPVQPVAQSGRGSLLRRLFRR